MPGTIGKLSREIIRKYDLDKPPFQTPENIPEDTLENAAKEYEEKVKKHLQYTFNRTERVKNLIRTLVNYDEPSDLHYKYVDEAISEDINHLKDEVKHEIRDKLAREIHEAIQDLSSLSESLLEPTEIIPAEAPKQLFRYKRSTPPYDILSFGGMSWLDAIGLEWLNNQTNGDIFSNSYEDAKNQAKKRWENELQKSRDALDSELSKLTCDNDGPSIIVYDIPLEETTGPEFLAAWVNPKKDIPWKLRPVQDLAEHLWKKKVKPEWERQGNPVPAQATGTRHGKNQDIYAKMSKAAGAVTMRGRTRQHPEGKAEPVDIDQDAGELTIDDERYTNAPGILRVVPQTWGIQPKNAGQNKPYQTKLPLSFDPTDGTDVSLAFRVFTDSQACLHPTAAKTVVALHLLAPETGELGTIDLGTLTRWVNQGRSRPGQKRNRKTVRKNLYAIRRLGIPPSLDGDRTHLSHNVQMLEIHPPDSLDKSADVLFGRTRGFQNLVTSLQDAIGAIGRLNGTFIMNADGFMRISGNDSDAARMYLTLCAMWNDHRWNPDSIPWTDLNNLAVLANTLSLPARRYLEGNGGDRTRLSKDRKQTKGTAEKLLEEHKLIGDIEIKKNGHHQKLRILPTDEHRDAWKQIRNHGDRPIDI